MSDHPSHTLLTQRRSANNAKSADESAKKPLTGRRLFRQIMIYFITIAMAPLIIVSVVQYMAAREALLETEGSYLKAISSLQLEEIRNYLEEVENIVGLVADSPAVQYSLLYLGEVTKDDLPGIEENATYLEVSEFARPIVRDLRIKLGFKQILLINNQGVVVYSNPALPVENRDLRSPENIDNQLAKSFESSIRLMSPQAGDYDIFPPTNEPALFITSPVFEDGILLGAVALVPENEKLLSVIEDTTGLGETGEVMFLAQRGDSIVALNKLRTEDTAAFTKITDFDPPKGQPLNPSQRAVRGMSGGALDVDYRDKEVVAIWDYLPNLRLGLVLKIDRDEVFGPVNDLLQASMLVAGITLLVVFIAAILMSRGITQPIASLTDAANRLAQGDLTADIRCKARNEIGQLSAAAQTMSANLKSLVSKVKVTAEEISSTSSHLNSSASQQVTAAEQTGTASVEVNATAKEISTTSRELAQTMKQVNEVTLSTALKAEAGLDVLTALQASMKELGAANDDVSEQLNLINQRAYAITSVIATMTKVADQTNLLSLNASIEAKKAGVHGRGFSVVATEIRRLADQAASSTLEIEQSVQDMLTAVQTGVKNMGVFSNKVDNSVSEIIDISSRLTDVIQQVQGLPPRFDMILEGMESQAEGASQINVAMGQLSSSAQQTANAVRETNRMIMNLKRSADVLRSEITRFQT
ncbi:methyl-accepting chemotaxis protein [Cerasicoccus fimbriatus]|uniref:methyl-accepting chemotaxis protein n=1 Tax=Cerasicoccus fimbriatus TaxID=3014554 RepID=UPI0022B512CE|nr:methyl-accepting chemotaxis protein [Cerasicoccus sp. TK19100]